MAQENKKISTTGIVADEQQLNTLFHEALSGIRDDLNEAQQNVDLYLDSILNTSGGKDVYGDLYNKALAIKGQARDKQLKFLDMFKDRVTKKEIISANVKKESDVPFDHSELNKIVDQIQQGKKYELAKPLIDPGIKTVEEEFYQSDDDQDLYDDESVDIELEDE